MEYMQNVIQEIFTFGFISECEDIKFKTDYSQFNCVDGEEGDFGKVFYYLGDKLFCTRVVHGGDCEDYFLTKEGKKFISELLIKRINAWVKE